MSTAGIGQAVTAIQQQNGSFANSDSVTVSANVGRIITWPDTPLPDGTTYAADSIWPDVVLEERCEDQTVITENPVEHGSMTSDHAYEQPSEVELSWAWSPSGGSLFSQRKPTFLRDTYSKLRELKSKHILLSAVTGKRSYQNMLIQGLSEVTDEKTENLLSVRIFLKQIILTSTRTVTILGSADSQKEPEKTAPTLNRGTQSLQPASNFNTGQ